MIIVKNTGVMKVLLVSFYNTEAYGVRSLHASALKENRDVRMLFFKMEIHNYEKSLKKGLCKSINEVTEDEISKFIDYVLLFNPDVLAFSLVSSHFHVYKVLVSLLKTKGFAGKIVVGGWEASLNPERCINFADYVCVGEGEIAFCELLNCLEQRKDCSNIQNFWSKRNGIIIKNKPRSLNQNLSDTPIPVFSNNMACFIENNELILEDPHFKNDRYGTFIGIGCPYHCTYCSNNVMATQIYPKEWSRIRFHTIERMKAEMVEVKTRLKNIKVVNFYDEVFSPDISWASEFFSWYKKEIDIPFCCTFFPGKCPDDLCSILSRSGMTKVWLGVQSGSQRVRSQVFKRFYTNEQVLDQSYIFKKYNVIARYDFIFDNPFESFNESLESINLILQFPQPFSINQFSLKFFPHTEITNMALREGFIEGKDVVDRISTWQDNYNISKDGFDLERTFINRIVSLISFLAKDGNLTPSVIQNIITEFRNSGNLDLVTKHLSEFMG